MLPRFYNRKQKYQQSYVNINIHSRNFIYEFIYHFTIIYKKSKLERKYLLENVLRKQVDALHCACTGKLVNTVYFTFDHKKSFLISE